MWKWIYQSTSGRLLMGLVVVIAAAPSAGAQVRALVVTTAGEQHEGRNLGYRIDRGEVAVRTGLHTEPRLPVNQVAMIEFAPPPVLLSVEEIERYRAGEHLLVRRDGRLVRGRLLEVGHEDRGDESTPYLVTFQTADAELRLDVTQVSRIFLTDVRQGLQGVSPAPVGIRVPAQQQWTPTGIFVQEGATVTFRASGEVQLSRDLHDVASPAGSVTARYAPRAPLRNHLAGALIGRIGNSPPFGIGDQAQVPMPASGRLFLGINDGDLEDNRGEFIVIVEYTGSSLRR